MDNIDKYTMKKEKTRKKNGKKSKNNKEAGSRSRYSMLLKDPRWQKKRLEIFQRDGFACQSCGSGLEDGVPLNVHHKVYYPELKPWEYDDDELITLCEKCHHKLHNSKDAVDRLFGI